MLRMLLALLVGAVLTLACSDDDGGDDQNEALSVRIGVVQSLTGDGIVYGQSSIEGIELAIEELEAAGTGLQIDYSTVDDMSSIEEGVAAYNSFIEEGVDAIIGPALSRIGFEALAVAQQESMPAIAPVTAAAGIGEIGDYVFRIALSEGVTMPPLIEYVSGQMEISEGVLFYDSTDAYSVSTAEAMREGMAGIGATIALEADVSQDGAVEDAIANGSTSNAQVLLISTFSETAVPVLNALREAGHDQTVIGGAGFAALHLLDDVGAEGLEGTYLASTWHPDAGGEGSADFVASYTETYGRTPENYAAISYASIQVLVDALRRAGSTDAAALRDALAATDSLDTVVGQLSMSSEGNAEVQPTFQQYQNGELVALE